MTVLLMMKEDIKEIKEMLKAKSEIESSIARDLGRLIVEVGWVSVVCKVCSCIRSYNDLADPKQHWLRILNESRCHKADR